MSIENFFTVHINQTIQPGGPAQAGNGRRPLQGMNFIDLILAQLAEIEDGSGEGESNSGEVLQSGNPVLDKNPKMNVAELLAENPEIVEEVQQYALDTQGQLTETLALNQQAFDEILSPLTEEAATINTETPNILETFMIDGEGAELAALNKLKAILNKIENLIEGNTPAGELLVTGLTPEQLTEIKAQIEAILNGDAPLPDDEQPFAGLFIGMIKMLPPQAKNGTVLTPQTIPQQPNAQGNTASQLNNLVVGEEAASTNITEGVAEEGIVDTEEDGFEHILRQAAGKKVQAQTSAGNNATSNNNGPNVTPDLNYLQGWPFTLTGSLFAPLNLTTSLLEELGLNSTNAPHINGLSQLTNLVSQGQGATQAHPATQLVAATLQKNANGLENRNIILQLDPPDLGKVEVRMSFGEDKTIKAVLLIEKPETHMMLQRDAHVLERALAESGLDSDNGLSFELASHDHDFGHNGRHDGHSGQDEASADEADNTEIIETTMTWHVDPETGHMRYDIVV